MMIAKKTTITTNLAGKTAIMSREKNAMIRLIKRKRIHGFTSESMFCHALLRIKPEGREFKNAVRRLSGYGKKKRLPFHGSLLASLLFIRFWRPFPPILVIVRLNKTVKKFPFFCRFFPVALFKTLV